MDPAKAAKQYVLKPTSSSSSSDSESIEERVSSVGELKRPRTEAWTEPNPKRIKASDNNQKMHPRNLYFQNPPNFLELGDLFPSFKPFVKPTKFDQATIDWRDPLALCELTKSLLSKDFGIKIEIPPDQLCPTVTSRINYILWIEDLLALKKPTDPLQDPKPTVRGIDIGTGASCIYPLLGVSMNNWDFLATDIDPVSIEWAQQNIQRNSWEHKISLKLVTNKGGILQPDVLPADHMYDFSMCNPPFFEYEAQKIENPKQICAATHGELVTEGGEEAFIKQMIDDSLILKEKIHWYTSLIGRKVNLKKIKQYLQAQNIKNIRETAFYQGNTTRWGIAWSFGNDGIEGLKNEIELKFIKGKSELRFGFKGDAHKLAQFLEVSLKKREMKTNFDLNTWVLTVNVYENASWVKRQENPEEEQDQEMKPQDVFAGFGIGPMMPPQLRFSFKIAFLALHGKNNYHLNFSYLKGDSLDLFGLLFLELQKEVNAFSSPS